LSSDNEIIALKNGGISLYGLLPPVLVFCLIGFLLTFLMAAYGAPRGKYAIKALTIEVISANLDIGLKERTFNDSFEGVMLYINQIDVKNKTLNDVFIEDKRNEEIVSTVVAPKGKLLSEADNFVFHLKLYDGVINQVGLEDRSAHSISFDSYDIRLDMKKAAALDSNKGEREMGVAELQEFLKGLPEKNTYYNKVVMELQKKFSIPAACFTLGILAIPLGIQSRRAKRSSGLGLGLGFFLLYYILLSLGLVFGETGAYPPVLAMWMPNLIMGILGLSLLVLTANERQIRIGFLNRRILGLIYRPVKKQT
jgi:lipopolysaccharide export system permease protein